MARNLLDPVIHAQAWNLYAAFQAEPRVGFAPEPEGDEDMWKGLAVQKTESHKVFEQGGLELQGLNPLIIHQSEIQGS